MHSTKTCRRQFERNAVDLQATYLSLSGLCGAGRISSLSEGGCFMETCSTMKIPIGEPIKVALKLKFGKTDRICGFLGTVVRSTSLPSGGVAVRLWKLSRNESTLLKGFLALNHHESPFPPPYPQQ